MPCRDPVRARARLGEAARGHVELTRATEPCPVCGCTPAEATSGLCAAVNDADAVDDGAWRGCLLDDPDAEIAAAGGPSSGSASGRAER